MEKPKKDKEQEKILDLVYEPSEKDVFNEMAAVIKKVLSLPL